jgi:fluoroquinolone resistance protein
MDKIYIEEATFEQVNFDETPLQVANYESCRFIGCNFSNADLSYFVFSECTFTDCNLSMAILAKTAFRDTQFKGCKLLGLHFDHCNEFITGLVFDNCILNISCFYKLKLKNTVFNNSNLLEVDFTETDLSGSSFNNCDMAGAVFENTILEKADLSNAYNYAIDPELNRIKKAKFSIAGIKGLLTKYAIEIV